METISERKTGRSGSEWDNTAIQDGLSKWHAFLSLVLIEVPFLVLRFAAFINFQVPIGILALKNIHSIYADLAKIFPSCSINEHGEGHVPDCPHGMQCQHTDLEHFQMFQHPEELFELMPDHHVAKPSIDRAGSMVMAHM
jgi:hypothetical protein